MNTEKAVRRLEEWAEAKRRRGLSDAHVQMARELGLSPKRLMSAAGMPSVPLAQRIEELYVSRFRRTIRDPVVPLRQLLKDARAREKVEARERRRRKRQFEQDHLEAMRVSMLTLRRLYGGPGARDVCDGKP